MLIASISDIHGKIKELDLPPADILIFAGDLLRNYSWNRREDGWAQLKELVEFNDYLGELKKQKLYREIIVVAGNHDFCFEHHPHKCREILTNAIMLQDEAVNLGGPDGEIIKIYGSPWQPWFGGWAFNFPNQQDNHIRGRFAAEECWAKIPDDTEILITHGPPFEILDECPNGDRPGCVYLKNRIQQLTKLKAHYFGHIHHSAGQVELDGVKYINTAICDEAYEAINPIPIIEIISQT